MIPYSSSSSQIPYIGWGERRYHLLNKYGDNIDPVDIPTVRNSLKILMQKSVSKRITSQSEFLGFLADLVGGEEGLGGKKRLYVFLARMETLKQIFVEESIRAQEKYLIDFNVNVEYVFGSGSNRGNQLMSNSLNSGDTLYIDECLCILELFLKNNKTGKIEKVQIEMKKPELRTFLATLKKMEKEVKYIEEV